VWSGRQAKLIGLVDELGGTDRAIEVAKHLAHIPSSNSIRIVRLPEEKTFFEQIFEKQKEQMRQSQSLEATLRHILTVMEPVQARLPYELHIK
jgi:protease IV